MKPTIRFLLLLLAWTALGRTVAWGQVCATPGKDGSPGALSGVVNTYFPGTGTAASTTRSISVAALSGATGTGITAGDLLLVIQMQGADINGTDGTAYGANNGTGTGNLAANFTAGTYEYVVAGSSLATGAAGTITTTTNLVNTYSTVAATATTGRRSFQVVRIPQYTNVTLGGQVNAAVWNGSTGGILAMDVAGTLTLAGQTLNATASGFRGGAGIQYTGNAAAGGNNTTYRTPSTVATTTTGVNGTKGEGTAGTPRYTAINNATLVDNTTALANAFASGVTNGYANGDNGRGAPGNAGGGSTDAQSPTANGYNAGGAGGGNGANGGFGGSPRNPNLTLPDAPVLTVRALGGVAFAATSTRLVMGGGGGAGSNNDGIGPNGNVNNGIGSSGSAGGGIILVRVGSLSGTGTASASGDGGYLISGANSNDGTGGGGAGGTVLVTARNTAGLANLTVLANGGAGNSNKATDVAHGPGGGGSGGVILTNGALAAATSVTGGAAGTTTYAATASSSNFGATAGANGTTTTNITTPITNSVAGADCIADVSVSLAAPSSTNVGQTVSVQATFSNIGAVAAAGTVRTVTLPAGATVTSAPGGTIAVNGVTGVTTVTYPTTTLNAGNAATFTITYVPSAATANTTLTLNAAVSTTTTEGGLTANNSAQAGTSVSALGAVGTPAPCATPGKDGSPTLAANPNTYYPATASASAGATSLTVGAGTLGSTAASATTISNGDLLLVIQMQGADINSSNSSSYGDGVAGGGASGNLTTNFQAGTYEYVVATNATPINVTAGGTITLASALVNGYVSSAASATAGARRFQVVRVPQYASLTLGANLTATPWNGSIGGIIALDVAGQTNFSGNTIDASGAGFRGGAGRTLTTSTDATSYLTTAASNNNAQKGEGTAGTPQYLNNNGTLLNTNVDGYPGGSSGRGAPGNAGGGGDDNSFNSGGGGGANGGAGGRGGNTYKNNAANGGEPGAGFSVASSSRLALGGGGGAGSTNEGTGTPNNGFASSGAAGGGLVIVRTGSVSGTGSILANAAPVNNTALNDGAGGGGAGGSILVTASATSGLSGLTLSANGSNGGNNTPATNGGTAHGPGGGGGGGVILTNGAVASSSTAAGLTGQTTYSTVDGNSSSPTATAPYGAAPGSAGLTNFQISTSIANSTAGATCRPAPVANNITNTNRPGGQAAAPVNSLSGTTFGTIASYTISGLDASQGTYYVNGVVLNTTNFPGLVLTAAQAGQLSFAPAASFSGTSSFSYTATDDLGVVSTNVATYTVPVSATGASGTPAPCATAGKDGSPTVATNPNAYYPSSGSQTLAAGATSIAMGAATGAATNITAGDLLLVIQMQGADIDATNTDSYGDGVAGGGASGNLTTNFTAGTYEYVVAANTVTTAGGTLNLTSGLKNTYSNAAATTTTGQRTFQVIRVPQYTNLTLGANLTATPWNGSSGGIIVLDVAGQLNLAGFTIDASGAGFRGGAGRTQLGASGTSLTGTDYRQPAASATSGQKGEGTAGTPRYVNNNGTLGDTGIDGYPNGSTGRGAPGNAGGGGTDNDPVRNQQNDGGGGGANGGFGGRGGNAWATNAAVGGEPGAAFTVTSTSRLVLGGGGGAGSTNDGSGTPGNGFASSGAAGGGLVMVRAGSVTGTGTILANGTNAYNTVANDGNGGGGAGGSILLTAANPAGLANLTLSANGGLGGSNNPGANVTEHGPGGGGGGGVILTNGSVAAATVAAGANGTTTNGTTNSPRLAFGAATGLGGVSNTQVSSSITNSTAGTNCQIDVATTLTGPATANAGQPTGTFTATFSNLGGGTATNVAQTVVLPTGAGLSAAQQATIKAAYPAASFIITGSGTSTNTTIDFGTLPTLAGGASNAYSFAYTAPGTPGTVATTSNAGTASLDVNSANNSASVTTTVAAAADVTVALNGPTTLNAGQPTGTFTATFTNEGPSVATNVSRVVTLPAGATLTAPQLALLRNAYPSATYSSTTNAIDFGSLPTLASDASSAVAFAFTAPTALGSSTLTGTTSTSAAEGNNTAPNQTTLALNTVTTADVVATILASNTATTGTFAVTFSNNGPQTAAGVVRTVQLPAGLTGVTFTGDAASYDATTGLVTYSTSPTTIAAGGSLNSTISYALASSLAPAAATAAISTTTNEAGQTANNTATVQMPAAFDLATTLTGPSTTIAGSPTQLFVTTTNNGPNAAPTATQTVIIPSAGPLTNVYITNGGTYLYNTASGLGTVTFPNVLNLPVGQTVTNSISFNAPGSSFAPSAVVAGPTGDTNTANNTAYLNGNAASTSVAVAPATPNQSNEATTITADATIVGPGTVVTYTVTAANKGALNTPATTNVAEVVQLLPGLTATTLTVGGVTGTPAGSLIQYVTAAGTTTYDPATGIVTYPVLASQASGTTFTFDKLAVTVPATTGNNGQLLATAAVSTALSDPTPSDNVSSVVVKVQTTADLATTLTGTTTVAAGQTASYTATFVNRGTGPATNVVETVQLPAGLSNVLVQDANGNVINNAYVAATGLVTLPAIATAAAGSSQVYGISFTTPAQSFPLTSTVSSGTTDNNTTNNTAPLRTTVSPAADVAVYVTGPATAVAGNAVTYAVTYANNGPAAASAVQATLQLPAGLNGVVLTGGGVYNATTGLVTFPSVNLAAGDSRVGLVTFTMPASPAGGQVSGNASVTTTSTDLIASNNTAGITTDVAPATTDMADLVTSISQPASPAPAGSAISYTLGFRNSSTTTAAIKVMPTAYLPAGLSNVVVRDASNNIVPNAYNSATGQIVLPTIDSQAPGNLTSYTVSLTAPANATAISASAVSSNTSDPNPTNNVQGRVVDITPVYDVVTSLAGATSAQPGSVNTYTLTTTNNGPSTSSATAGSTTQSVTVPAGSVVGGLPSGASYNSGTGVITFPAISSQGAGPGGAVSNTFTVQMPASGSLVIAAAITATGESNTTNNQASLTTAPANQAPVAQNVWNTLQSARGNTSPTGLLISPLYATDADGTVSTYAVATLPPTTQGVLYLANGAAVVAGQPVPANGLYFVPNPSFVGNATFTYSATDNASAVSNRALYTIPVAADQNSAYTTYNSGKSIYAANEVLAQAVDPNAAVYNGSGTIYSPTGVLQTGATNGLANAVLASGTLPTGVSLDPATGRIYVSDPSLLPKLTQTTSYSLQVTTTDANGGTSTVPVTFALGATPLSVSLVEFTAQSVANRDALLNWHTATEQNNDHFEVERSFDGTSFTKIGQLAGHGTTTAASAYTFTDAGVAARATGAVYYRLRQVDLDGTATYSPQRTVSFTKIALAKLTLFPNPVAERTSLDLSALPATGTFQAQLLDATGRLVRTWSLAGGIAQPLEVAGLASGSYLLVVTGQQPDGSVLKQTLRLTKE